jgi:putative transposase
VQPATVLAWHRKGFRLYWRWKSRPNPVGRPRLDAELRDLVRRMARENPTWGRRRIRAELALLGYEVAELTVAKYMHRTSPRPSPMWRAFLTAHARDIVGIDFFVVPTITFHLLFVFVVLRHHRRELLHVNVTDHPSAVWAARQVIEAFPEETGPKYLLRDRDSIYGEAFARRVDHVGIRQVITAPRAPWQNPFAERVIGSIRRECLDHVIILTEAHLCRVLRAYVAYYNTTRPHQSLDNNSPQPRAVEPSLRGRITPSLRSAASITATLALPDRGRPAGQPSPARAIHPDWNGQSALQSSAATHPTILSTLNPTWLWFRTFAASVRRSRRLADEVPDRHTWTPPPCSCR